jgi:hypothetical protein
MNLIAKIGVGKHNDKITIRSFETFIGTFSRLVSVILKIKSFLKGLSFILSLYRLRIDVRILLKPLVF